MTVKNKSFAVAFCAFLLCVFAAALAPLNCRAAQVSFGPFTNALTGQLDTNTFRVFPCSEPVINDGSVFTTGLPIRLTPSANGTVTNTMGAGNFLVTNQFLGRGFVIKVPIDSGPQLYRAFRDLIVSSDAGGSVFVTVYKYSNTPAATYNDITNALGYIPEKTNLFLVASNILNGNIVAASNYSAALSLSLSNAMRTADTAISNLFPIYGTAATNYILQIGANGTNFTKGVGTSLTNALLSLGANATNNDLALGLNGTNFTKLCGLSASNYVLAIAALSSNYSATLYASATNFSGTNHITLAQLPTLPAQGVTNGLPATLTTNYLGLSLSGTPQANGTYSWSGSAYTNAANSALFVTNISSTWYVYSNTTALYSGSSPTNTVTTVSGVAPAPSSAWGYIVNNYGNVYTGIPINTNTAAQIAVAVAAHGVSQTNDTRAQGLLSTNFTYAIALLNTNLSLLIGLNGTNNATAVSNGVVTYANLIGLAATNKANANGVAITNYVTRYADKTNSTIYSGLIIASGTLQVSNITAIGDGGERIDFGSGDREIRFFDENGNGINIYSAGGDVNIKANGMTISNAVTVKGNIDMTGDFTFDGVATGDGSGLNTIDGGAIETGTIPIARMPAGVSLTNLANKFTGSNWFNNSLRIATNLYVDGSVLGNGAGWTNLNGANIQATTVNSNAFNVATSNALFSARTFAGISVGAFTNAGDSYFTNLADATAQRIMTVNPSGGANPYKVATITANGNTAAFLDGTFALNTSVVHSMLPLGVQLLNTNNGGLLTNLNAGALQVGTVPRVRLESALQNFLGAYTLYAGGTIAGAGPISATNGAMQALSFLAYGNGSIFQDTVTLGSTAEIFRINDNSSGKDMIWFSIDAPDSGKDATMVESTNLFVHNIMRADRINCSTNFAPMVEDTNAVAFNTLYTNTTGKRFCLQTTITNSGSAAYCALVVNRGNGFLTNSTVNTFGTLTTWIGTNNVYAVSNWGGTWAMINTQKLN
jgi:hypothetical protein